MPKDPISLIDAKLLKIAAPNTPLEKLEPWVEPIKGACARFEIDTVREVACFLAQGSHESGGFTDLDENLSYSAERLVEVWPKRFPTIKAAAPYARNPQRLANKVYANRLGNGDELSGDGWRFRGGGMFQLTGRWNYSAAAKAFNMPVADFADWVRTIPGAAASAGWFFQQNNLDRYAATPGVEDETKVINGGHHGLAQRRDRFDALVKELLRRGA